MSFALIIIGLFLLISAIKNTQGSLFTLIHGDFTGSNNFIFWLVAILIVGAVGYIERIKPVSNAFLVLIVLALFLKKGAPLFTTFTSSIASTQQASASTGSNTQSVSSSTSSIIGNIIGAING